jgi:(2R)-ethylmalonyl-CoA mutase
MGGAIAAIDYMKGRKLVEANADRVNAIERGETVVVGVNKYTQSEPSPLMGEDGGIMVVDPAVEEDQIARLNAWRAARDEAPCAALARIARRGAGRGATSCPPPSRRRRRA